MGPLPSYAAPPLATSHVKYGYDEPTLPVGGFEGSDRMRENNGYQYNSAAAVPSDQHQRYQSQQQALAYEDGQGDPFRSSQSQSQSQLGDHPMRYEQHSSDLRDGAYGPHSRYEGGGYPDPDDHPMQPQLKAPHSYNTVAGGIVDEMRERRLRSVGSARPGSVGAMRPGGVYAMRPGSAVGAPRPMQFLGGHGVALVADEGCATHVPPSIAPSIIEDTADERQRGPPSRDRTATAVFGHGVRGGALTPTASTRWQQQQQQHMDHYGCEIPFADSRSRASVPMDRHSQSQNRALALTPLRGSAALVVSPPSTSVRKSSQALLIGDGGVHDQLSGRLNPIDASGVPTCLVVGDAVPSVSELDKGLVNSVDRVSAAHGLHLPCSTGW